MYILVYTHMYTWWAGNFNPCLPEARLLVMLCRIYHWVRMHIQVGTSSNEIDGPPTPGRMNEGKAESNTN